MVLSRWRVYASRAAECSSECLARVRIVHAGAQSTQAGRDSRPWSHRHPPCPSRVYIPNIHPSFPNTCISCVKRQYPSRTLKLSHIELCQYCRGGPDGKPGSCIPFSFFIQHSTMDQMDTPPEDPPRLESVDVVHTIVFFLSTTPSQSIEEGSTYRLDAVLIREGGWVE